MSLWGARPSDQNVQQTVVGAILDLLSLMIQNLQVKSLILAQIERWRRA
jgi:hypothetical protein